LWRKCRAGMTVPNNHFFKGNDGSKTLPLGKGVVTTGVVGCSFLKEADYTMTFSYPDLIKPWRYSTLVILITFVGRC